MSRKTDIQLNRLAKRMIFSIPPVQWPAIMDRLEQSDRMSLTRKLDGICSQAALATGYCGARESSPHNKSVLKEMNRRNKDVRRALGYMLTVELNF